jgi:hypothetical protein
MAQASASITVPASADQVWQLIGGFDSLPDWLPYIPKSVLSEGGRVRKLSNPNGDDIIERLVAFDEPGRSYSYRILSAPFPVKDYQSTLAVHDDGPAARVEWRGVFTPVGVSDQDAVRLFQGIYEDGLKALAERFSAPAH